LDQMATNALFESASKLLKDGLSNTSYRRIDYEKVGRRFQKKIKEDIEKNGNPCDPNTFNGKNFGK